MEWQPNNRNYKPHSNIHDEEIIDDDQSPTFAPLSRHLHQDLPSPHRRSTQHDVDGLIPAVPQSPESLWAPTPPITPSHPSLLYCCISSLRYNGEIHTITPISSDLVLTGSTSRRVHAWQFNCQAKGYIQASSGEVRAMVAYNDTLFTSHKDHKVRVWKMRNSSIIGSNLIRARKMFTIPSATHFKNFLCRSISSSPHHRDIIVPQHKDTISCMAYYHVEGILYTGSLDRTIKTWKLSSKKCIDSFVAHGDHINNMVINQQNGHLFTCSSDGTVKMWSRVVYGESCCHVLIKVFTFQTCLVYALALSTSPSHSQPSFLYSGSSDGCINFWVQEISTHYNHGGVLEGHQFAVLCLVTLNNLLVSGSEDSTIRIWRRERIRFNHECLAVLEGHRGPVRCLAATLQDEFVMSFFVYSGSLDRTFKVWRVKLLREFKRSPGRRSVGDRDDFMEEENSVLCDYRASPVLSPSWVKKKLSM